ncbi:MAG: LptA/OstA family protein [Phenylobacterium sp.]|jgi:lipopolysaccharide export system protein LptA|uniref:LptA/OstA family protein n=1 Tax=Phenylobacterium sp. TaxID=1871053 RepID=UPI002A2A6003|nr:LptA/OstA family protein [Phenylobacterium sp.]MDD3837772.1 LptA/OstA family protein [Phenylobacterium sp.]MDX9997869.1 LptA/OstA family protein [Phenylobacterium sp.]
MILFRKPNLLAVAAAAVALLAGPASAQLARNSDAPVDITADELEVLNTQCLSIWRGSAEALQDNARLRANVLKTFFQVTSTTRTGSTASVNCGDLIRIEADGEVFYVTPEQRVRGRNAVYDAASETITVTGDVVAAQGQNVLRGDRLVINVSTGQAQMHTNVKGRGKPGRVRGVFYPEKQQQSQRR